MTRLRMEIMMEGLIATAVEKINVFGWEEAREDVEKIIDMVDDLEMFWGFSKDWLSELKAAIEKAREN